MTTTELTVNQKLDALTIFAGLAQIAREHQAAGQADLADRVTRCLASLDTESAAKLAGIIKAA